MSSERQARNAREEDPSSPGQSRDQPVAPLTLGEPGALLDRDCRTLYQELASTAEGDLGALAETLSWSQDRVQRTATRLARLRLVADGDGRVTVVRPEIAATAYLQLEQRALTDRLATLDHARQQILSLLPSYDAATSTIAGYLPISSVEDASTARSLLHHWATLAEHRVLTIRPEPEIGVGDLEDSLASTLAMLDRGVQLQFLFTHDTRQQQTVRNYVEEISNRGSEVRTTAALLPGTIIFDQTTAFLSSAADERTVMITDRSVVLYLVSAFELAWQGAQPYSLGADNDASMESLHVALLQQLATGRKDEQIARQLGLSLRTCRRHIATVMSLLGAASRFQAGVVATRRALLDK